MVLLEGLVEALLAGRPAGPAVELPEEPVEALIEALAVERLAELPEVPLEVRLLGPTLARPRADLAPL